MNFFYLFDLKNENFFVIKTKSLYQQRLFIFIFLIFKSANGKDSRIGNNQKIQDFDPNSIKNNILPPLLKKPKQLAQQKIISYSKWENEIKNYQITFNGIYYYYSKKLPIYFFGRLAMKNALSFKSCVFCFLNDKIIIKIPNEAYKIIPFNNSFQITKSKTDPKILVIRNNLLYFSKNIKFFSNSNNNNNINNNNNDFEIIKKREDISVYLVVNSAKERQLIFKVIKNIFKKTKSSGKLHKLPHSPSSSSSTSAPSLSPPPSPFFIKDVISNQSRKSEKIREKHSPSKSNSNKKKNKAFTKNKSMNKKNNGKKQTNKKNLQKNKNNTNRNKKKKKNQLNSEDSSQDDFGQLVDQEFILVDTSRTHNFGNNSPKIKKNFKEEKKLKDNLDYGDAFDDDDDDDDNVDEFGFNNHINPKKKNQSLNDQNNSDSDSDLGFDLNVDFGSDPKDNDEKFGNNSKEDENEFPLNQDHNSGDNSNPNSDNNDKFDFLNDDQSQKFPSSKSNSEEENPNQDEDEDEDEDENENEDEDELYKYKYEEIEQLHQQYSDSGNEIIGSLSSQED